MSFTSVIRYVRALDSAATDGSGKTALAFGDITAAYRVEGGTTVALTTQDITTLGTYQAPTSNAHIRIKKVSDSDPWKGWLEVHFHDDQVAAAGKKLWLALSASGAAIQPYEMELSDYRLPDAPPETAGGLAGHSWLVTNVGLLGASLSAIPKTGYKLASDGLAAVSAWTVAITGNITGNLTGSVGSIASFGTLVADVATAVWAAASRTLTAFGFTVDTNANATESAAAAAATSAASSAASAATSAASADSKATTILSGQTTINSNIAGVDAKVTTVDSLVDQLIAAIVTAQSEPGSGAPPVSASMDTKISYIYKFLRNKSSQSSSQQLVYNDAGDTADHARTVDVTAGVVTLGEVAAP